ncbi:MAG: anthranilate phosphoribosyltransferase [Gemmatimonadota bacterium]|nr:anthranilate phosphoribosyltransferase [Gemmatimonadota bacterium]
MSRLVPGSAQGNPLVEAIRHLTAGISLSADETSDAFDVIMRGEGTPAQIGALLVALAIKGETALEVAGGARALRAAMLPLEVDDFATLVDTCGTGGGSFSTFNISTAAALVAAGAGVRIAKHGNRSYSSRCGSADVLEALGVDIQPSREVMHRMLERAGIVFMFAPAMHPAMRHVAAVRRELGVPTIMNLLGPLANPARAGRQVVGIANPARMELMAGALAELGSVHALVVHGEPGMDEISPIGCTRVLEIRNGSVTDWSIDPVRLDLAAAPGELAGGEPAENASRVTAVLDGTDRSGARSAVLLNAAAAVYVGGLAENFDDGLRVAADAIDSGKARRALTALREASLGD